MADCHRSPSCAAGRDTQLSSQRRRLIVSPLRNRFVPLRRRNISSTKMASPCKSNHPNIVTSCKHGSDCVALGRVDDNPDSLLDRYCDCEASEILVAGIECEVSRPSTARLPGTSQIANISRSSRPALDPIGQGNRHLHPKGRRGLGSVLREPRIVQSPRRCRGKSPWLRLPAGVGRRPLRILQGSSFRRRDGSFLPAKESSRVRPICAERVEGRLRCS